MTTERDRLAAAYEGLEASFSDQAARDAYRAAMLARSAEQADFLGPMLDGAAVLEVGCGNGRLLIELTRRGVVREGIGIDTAASRIQFARQWATGQPLASLRFEVADALELEPRADYYDAVLCITGAFAYFEPLAPGTAASLVARWVRALRPNGLLVLELYPHPEVVRLVRASAGPLRLWRELEAPDPWRFYLSELRLEDGVLVHAKTFIHRTTGEVDAGRVERLMIYSVDRITSLLAGAGLVEIACRDGWSDRPYDQAEVMVVTARAAG